MMKKQLSKIILIILGILILSLFIWLRFIRERLPRDIPFDLTVYGFFILVYICCIYIYILKRLSLNIQNENKVLSTIVNMIYKPLKTLDESIKNNLIIKPYYEKFLLSLINIIKNNVILHEKSTSYFKFYIALEILPRVILVTGLLIDTFWFHRLAILYSVISIVLVIFIAKYIKYSFKYAKEQYILQLEQMVQKIMTDYEDPEDDDSPFTTMLEVRKFIEIQVFTVEDGLEPWTCTPILTPEYIKEFFKLNNFYEKDTLTRKEIVKKISIDSHKIMDKVIDISVHISKYEIAENYSRYRYIKIGIFSLYLIAWIYILIKSIHTLDIEEIISIIKIKDIIEPFSGLDI